MPRGLPITEQQIAGIVWGEAPHIMDKVGPTTVLTTSNRTAMHRLAIAIVVVNRARQNLTWGTPGVQDTVVPMFPSAADLALPGYAEKWLQCEWAAREARSRMYLPITHTNTLIGAQMYFHSYVHAQRTPRRFQGTNRTVEHVASYIAYDNNRHQFLWLNVHLDRPLRDNFLARPTRRTSSP